MRYGQLKPNEIKSQQRTLTKMLKVQVKLGSSSREKTLGMPENTGFAGSVVANWLQKSVINLLSE